MQYITREAMVTFLEESEPTLLGKPLSDEMKAHILAGIMPVCLEDGRAFQVATAPKAPRAPKAPQTAPTAPVATMHGRPVSIARAPRLIAAARRAAYAATDDDGPVAA
ncbi:MAG: hypothetical protein JW940_02685 [Polyangiaceae bacterium]|nr:hypothetical protein [Polyangiaceae bacterium]